MRRFFRGFAIILTLLPSWLASAQAPPVTTYPAPWNQVGNIATLSVTNTSGNVVLGWVAVGGAAPQTAQVCNTGANAAYVLLGGSGVVVTTLTGFPIQPGGCIPLAINGNGYLAGITAASTTTLTISSGNGSLAGGAAPPAGYTAPTIGSTVINSGATVPSLAGLTNLGFSGTLTGPKWTDGANFLLRWDPGNAQVRIRNSADSADVGLTTWGINANSSVVSTTRFGVSSNNVEIGDTTWRSAMQSVNLGSLSGVCWTNGNISGTADTAFSRTAAGALALGNCTQGDFSGSLKLATLNAATAVQDNGVAPVGTAGTGYVRASALPPAPNLIYNGAMDLDQANEGANVTANNVYVTDGWQAISVATGWTYTMARSATAPPSTFANSLLTTITGNAAPAAGDLLLMKHQFTGDEITNTAFGTAGATTLSLSFWVKSSVAGTYAFVLANGASSRFYIGTCAVTTGWTQCTAQIPGDTAGAWTLSGNLARMYLYVTLAAGSTYNVGTAGSWSGTTAYATAAQTQLPATNGATFNLTGVKLEISPTVTPFAREPQLDLVRAQRFYRKTFPQGTAPVQSGGVAGSVCVKNPIALGDPSMMWQWSDSMRATPTVTTYNPSAANANWRNVTAAADVVVSKDPATSLAASTGILLATSGTVATLGDVLCIHAVADARL